MLKRPFIATISGMADSSETPTIDRQAAAIRLSRTASAAGRPGIFVLNEDGDALDELTGSRVRTHALIKQLESERRLQRVRRGAYVLVDSNGNVNAGILDLIGVLTPTPHLVTGGRALQFHNLSDQHFRRIQVLVDHRIRDWSWRGDQVRYIESKMAITSPARTRKTTVRIATPERAIIDCMTHTRWGVTLGQVVEAVDGYVRGLANSPAKLAGEVALSGTDAVARRLGFLVSWIAGPEAAIPFMPLRGRRHGSTLLQAGGKKSGPVDSIWKVQVNVDLDMLDHHRAARR